MRKLISLLMVLMVALTFIGVSSAQSISGKSTLNLTKTSATISPGNSLMVNYTLTLVNGSANSTFLIIADGPQLASAGVGAGMNPGSGIPTYSGALNINVASNATPGTYSIVIETGGADPTNGPINFTVTVANGGAVNTTTAATTVPATTTLSNSNGTTVLNTTTISNSTGTGAPSGSGTSTGELALVAIIVVVVIVIIAAVVLRGNKKS